MDEIEYHADAYVQEKVVLLPIVKDVIYQLCLVQEDLIVNGLHIYAYLMLKRIPRLSFL